MSVTILIVLGTLALSIMTLLPKRRLQDFGLACSIYLRCFTRFIGLWIRKGIDETPSFKEVQAKGEIPKLPIIET